MTRIARVTDPAVSIALLPFYVDYEEPREKIAEKLHHRMLNHGDETLVLLAMDGWQPKAMFVAYLEKKYAWLWQVRVLPGYRGAEIMFDIVCTWAKAFGKKSIRGKCPRHLERFWLRKYGGAKRWGRLERKL